MSPAGTRGVLGRGGAGSGGGAPVSLRHRHVCGVFPVPFWQVKQPSDPFSLTSAGCLSIAAFTFLCPGHSTHRMLSSRTSVQGFLIRNWVSSIVVRKNPPLAILAIFNARRMSDWSGCTRPACLDIVADMLKTYVKLDAGSKGGSWLALAKKIAFGWNGSVRLDTLLQSRQRHPGGGLLRAWHQYNAARCISLSDRCFTISLLSAGLPF